MAITTLNKHDEHEVSVHLCKNNGPHYAALRCVKCNKHIQWLTYEEANQVMAVTRKTPRKSKGFVSLDSLGI